MIKTWGSNNKKNFFKNIALGKAAEKKIRQKKYQPLLTFKTCVPSHQTLSIIHEKKSWSSIAKKSNVECLNPKKKITQKKQWKEWGLKLK
jgi:hypothetical protein